MRYKINLLHNVKLNYIGLPSDSPLRHGLTPEKLCTAIKVQSVLTNQTFYFGFSGQTSPPYCLDISIDLARLLNLEQDSLVNTSIEYSFEHLDSIELEPLTVDDFELVEAHSAYIEEQLLNQIGVFYNNQQFVLWINNAVVSLQAKCKQTAKCYYLGVDSELHIQTKIRQKPRKIDEDQVVQPTIVHTTQKVIVGDSSLTPPGVINLPSQYGFKQDDIVKATFPVTSPPLSFKEFQALKLSNQPLPLPPQSKEVFYKVNLSDEAKANLQDHELYPGTVEIQIQKEIPMVKDRPIQVMFQTSHPLIRQQAANQNQAIFHFVKSLIKLPCVLSDGYKQQVRLDTVQVTDLCSQRVLDTVTDESITFTFMFGNPTSSLLSTMNAPKFILPENNDYFVQALQLGYNPSPIKSQPKCMIKQQLQQLLYSQTLSQIQQSIQDKQSFVLYGCQDVGKTTLMQDYDVVDCTQIGTLCTTVEQVDYCIQYLEMRYQNASKMLVLDGVQGVCQLIDTQQPDIAQLVKSNRVATWLLSKPNTIGLTCRHYSQLNTKLFQMSRFDHVIEMLPPTQAQRYEVFKEWICPQIARQELKLQQLAQSTEYFMAKDLHYLWINQANLFEVLPKYKQAILPMKVETESPDWDLEIGGLEQAKFNITEMFGITQRYGLFFEGQRINQGLLLYGPPGCGKTYLASSIAKKFNINFISVKGPELLNKYIGASEQNVRELFEKAQQQKPCILFFDEFDSLVPKRGGQSSVTDRIVNQFLCYLDGVEGRSGVFVMAATARPDLVDVALLRPGRVDKAVYCGFPSLTDRQQLLRIYLKKFNFKQDPSLQFLQELSEKTKNYTSADIKGLCQNAQLARLSKQMKDGSEGAEVTEHDIQEEVSKFVKGMTKEEMQRYEGIYSKWQDKGAQNIQEQRQTQQ